MDANEFSFEALFNCNDFRFDESHSFIESYAELNSMLENEMYKSDLQSRLDRVTHQCIYDAHADAFKQGFSFAVKSIKFIQNKQG